MASKKVVPKKLLATLVTGDRQPCAFCRRDIDDEATYGKLYAIGDIHVHYFCALLSCCLVQKGKDTEGLFGFLYHDIVAEVERSKKHKCSYCNMGGASLGCSVSQCRKQFHLPCGREKNAVSLFFGNYKSFCQQHAPKQKIPDHIMAQARVRMKRARNALKPQQCRSNDPANTVTADTNTAEEECVCVICYEAVEGFPSPRTFWPVCCARDAWFHKDCLQRMALSAGMHYLKCPLCNDKDQFYDAVVTAGYYVPDRDAAWELERDAFAGIYERAAACGADECLCPNGRGHDADTGEWDIQLCLLCGTAGRHAGCGGGGGGGGGSRAVGGRFVCAVCAVCAPDDIRTLAERIDAVMQEEQRVAARSAALRPRPVMPSRMSLRRTKANANTQGPSTSQITQETVVETDQKDSTNTSLSRLELNLKTPKLRSRNTEQSTKPIQSTIFSPVKLVQEGLVKKMGDLVFLNGDSVLTKVKDKLKKPRPLSVKKKIVDKVLDELVNEITKRKKSHKPLEWCSPKKICDIPGTDVHSKENINIEEKSGDLATYSEEFNGGSSFKEKIVEYINDTEDDSSRSTFQLPAEFIAERNSDDSMSLFETPKKLTTVDIQKDSSLEISENNEVVNINVVKMEENVDNHKEFFDSLKLKLPVKNDKCALKFNLEDKEALLDDKVDMDLESFKNCYLNEVDKEFKCNFNHKHIENKVDRKLRTAIDFALDVTKAKEDKRKNLKRKSSSKDDVQKKRTKTDNGIVLQYNNDNKNNVPKNIEVLCSNKSETETIDLTVESKTKKVKHKKKIKKNKKQKTRDSNIQVKIRFKKQQVRLKITQSQGEKNNTKIKKKNKDKKTKAKAKVIKSKNKKEQDLSMPKKLKQCILQYDGSSPSKCVIKPEHDVTPRKRNYVKFEKSPDMLVQTSIQSFFKKIV